MKSTTCVLEVLNLRSLDWEPVKSYPVTIGVDDYSGIVIQTKINACQRLAFLATTNSFQQHHAVRLRINITAEVLVWNPLIADRTEAAKASALVTVLKYDRELPVNLRSDQKRATEPVVVVKK